MHWCAVRDSPTCSRPDHPMRNDKGTRAARPTSLMGYSQQTCFTVASAYPRILPGDFRYWREIPRGWRVAGSLAYGIDGAPAMRFRPRNILRTPSVRQTAAILESSEKSERLATFATRRWQ